MLSSLLLLFGLLAQAQPSPAPTSTPPRVSPDPDVLLQQIEFLQKAHDSLAESFRSFTMTVNITVTIVLALIALLGLIGTFIFGKSLQEVTTVTDGIVRRRIAKTIGKRIDDLERVMELEEVIANTRILYVLPHSNSEPQQLEDFNMLEQRGFKDIRLESNLNFRRSRKEIVVLDVANITDPEIKDSKEKKDKLVCEVAKKCLGEVVFVIYYPGMSDIITKLRKKEAIFEEEALKTEQPKYWHPANTPVSLMGSVVDAAHVNQSLG